MTDLRKRMINHNNEGNKLFDEIDQHITKLEDMIKKLKGGEDDDRNKIDK